MIIRMIRETDGHNMAWQSLEGTAWDAIFNVQKVLP